MVNDKCVALHIERFYFCFGLEKIKFTQECTDIEICVLSPGCEVAKCHVEKTG